MKLKPEYQAFLEGYKPAVLIAENSEYVSELEKYPSVLIDRERDYNSHLFFHTEEKKQQYLNKIIDIEPDSYEDHYLLGITLGLPEKSVDFFARMQVYKNQTGTESKEAESYAIGIIWAGFSFTSHLQDVINEVTWIWEKYQHPKAMEYPLYLCPEINEMIEIPYGDQQKLRKVHQEICQTRG